MSALQAKVIKSILCLPDDKLNLVLESIHSLLGTSDTEGTTAETQEVDFAGSSKGIRLGMFNGMKYVAEGHDIDECNDEIAALFGVND